MFNLRYPMETAAQAQPVIGDRNYVQLLQIQNLRYLIRSIEIYALPGCRVQAVS